jgi:hypothetical protein
MRLFGMDTATPRLTDAGSHQLPNSTTRGVVFATIFKFLAQIETF